MHNFDLHNANIAISLKDSLVEAFHEDKALIEAQQKLLDGDPGFRLGVLGADEGLTHVRQTLNKRILAEQAEDQPARINA